MLTPSIIIHRLGSLGDTVVALPAFHTVRRAFPSAKITLLTNSPISSKAPRAGDVLKQGYFYNECIYYPRATRNPYWIAKIVCGIRKAKPDIAINLTEYKSDQAVARYRRLFELCGVRNLLGFQLSEIDRHQLPDPTTGLVEAEAARLLRRVCTLGTLQLDSREAWELLLDKRECQTADELLSYSSDDQILAFSVGTKMQAKDWGIDNWRSTVAQLSERLPSWKAIFVGAAEEREATEVCARHWIGSYINLCGLATPRVTAAALRRSRVFVGHDSGPMHLASAVGVPCVAVFSARVYPGKWFPWGTRHKCLYKLTDCANCKLEMCLEQNRRCLRAIKVAEVVEQTLIVVAESGHSLKEAVQLGAKSDASP
jgi:heptosyltransferase-3